MNNRKFLYFCGIWIIIMTLTLMVKYVTTADFTKSNDDSMNATDSAVTETAKDNEKDASAKHADASDDTDKGYLSAFEDIKDDDIMKIVNQSTISNVAKITVREHDDVHDVYIVTNENKYHLATENDEVVDYLKLMTDNIVFEENSDVFDKLLDVLFILGTFALISYVLCTIMRAAVPIQSGQNNGSGISALKPQLNEYSASNNTNVTMADVIGAEDLKNQAMQYVDVLKNPAKYTSLGAEPAKGLLIYGDPGNGKTYLAKAMATEAGIPFYSVAGSDFVNTFVGVGPANIRKLFGEARKHAPCIIFIDEFDALASKREYDTNGERKNTVDAILTEMDGVQSSEGVLVIAATNFLDDLDAAAIRPGRFDATLGVAYPNKRERLQAFKLYTKNKPLAEDVVLEQWATRTAGCSYAQIKTIANNAALLSGQHGKSYISYDEMNTAFCMAITKGGKNRLENEETRRMIAWHEAGHALTIKLLTDEAVPLVTNIGTTSGAGGYTLHHLEDDDVFTNRRTLLNNVKVAYGGRIGEEIYFNQLSEQGCLTTPVEDNITVGASGDINSATKYLQSFIAKVGFNGDKGMLDYSLFDDHDTKAMIRSESEKLAEKCMTETRDLLNGHKETLAAIADAVFAKEELNEEELDAIIAAHENIAVSAC